MELRRGYKQTEVGVIPTEWVAEALGPHIQINSGESPSLLRFETSGVPYFKVNQLNNDNKYLSETPYFFRKGKTVPRGSLIFPKRGASILLNKVSILASDSFMDTNLMTLTPQASLDNEYLYYTLSRIGLWKFADTTSIPQINNKHVIPLIVPIPRLPEQRAIAGALSDVDALLTKLHQLIAKKRDLKQAAMQQLLTGQTRLPGFSGEWEVKLFGELFQFLRTANNSRADLSEFGDVGYIHYGDIHTTGSAFLDCAQTGLPLVAQGRVTGIPLVEDGDFVMADASEDYAGIGKCVEVRNVRERKIVAGLHTFLLRGNKARLTNGFKGYLQFIPGVKNALIRFATGISVYGVSKTNVKTIEIQLPKSTEQNAIATVLSDMDAEIASLEARRDKTRALKQGMMQELLTGTIRLG